MANSVSEGSPTRFSQLVSFIGQTGAGKRTIVKMLIDQQESQMRSASKPVFPSPIAGSARNGNLPTFGDVHLCSDPATYLSRWPLMFADCEGLEGGGNIPLGARHRGHDSSGISKRINSKRNPSFRQRRHEIARGSQRGIAWATSPKTCKRQYAVTELHPRLLYTFSDVIVFVRCNPK